MAELDPGVIFFVMPKYKNFKIIINLYFSFGRNKHKKVLIEDNILRIWQVLKANGKINKTFLEIVLIYKF